MSDIKISMNSSLNCEFTRWVYFFDKVKLNYRIFISETFQWKGYLDDKRPELNVKRTYFSNIVKKKILILVL